MKSRVILVAEDSEDDVRLLEYAFRRADSQAELRFVSDGMQAMAYLKAEGLYADRQKYPFPAFLLLDIKMPRMNGLEVLQAIREDPDLRRLTVVIFSSSAHEGDLERATDLQVNSFLVKPSDPDTRQELCKLLDRYWLAYNRRAPCAGETDNPGI
jgi:CheY-like chemotaxis protein